MKAQIYSKISDKSPVPKVNDNWIFWSIYPLIAVLIVHIGNDNTFEELIQIPSYYTDLLFSLFCTYCVGLYFKWFFIKLDQRFDWDTEMRQRLIAQFIFGIIIPIVVIIGLEFIYLKLLPDVQIEKSSIFYLELPLVGIFCILVNLTYSMLYYRRHHVLTTHQLENELKNHPVSKNHKNNFVVHSGAKSLNIPVNEIAYFIVVDKLTYLVANGGRQYLYNSTLEQIKEETAPHDFFQLNRQVITHRKSIITYERTDTRKLKIVLEPKTSTPVFVSKIRASQFLNWLEK